MPVKIMLPPDHNSTDERFSRTGQNCMFAELEEPKEPMTGVDRLIRTLMFGFSASFTVWVITGIWRSL